MKDKYRITHYLPLISILAMSVVGFVLFTHDTALRISLALATGIAYFVWALIHHYLHKDLNISIVLEYLVICIFGVSAIILLIR